jgi:tetratricopeptide (TPR) repeat protein
MAIIPVAGIIAYLCASLAGFLGLDDVGMIDGLGSSEFSLQRLLFSGAGDYFRPVPFISYAIDANLAGMNPAWFHGMNLAIHLMNGVLVYLLMLHLVGEESERKSYLALTAGLIFTLHPLNTEAVMWVSARPDLLCTFFSLITLILLRRIEDSPKFLPLCALFALYFCSLLSKEVAIVLLAVVPFYLLAESGMKGAKKIALLSAPLFTAAFVWFFLRSGKKAVLDSGIRKVVTTVVATNKDHQKFLDLVAAYGFYLKKLVYPFPLNFAIIDFNRTAAFTALVLAAAAAVILFRCNRLSRLPLSIVLIGIIPPVAAYAAKLPWTPFAERYLYMPMVGFSLLLALLAYDIRNMFRMVPVVLALLLAIPTISRVSLWVDPVAFWRDTVVKSPRFPRGYVGLATAFINARDYDAAEKNLETARAMGYNDVPLWENLAAVYRAKKEYVEYEAAMTKLASISPDPTGCYIKLIENLARIPEPKGGRRAIYGRAIGYYLKILEKSPSFNLSYYNIGKLYWAMGERENAARYLELFLSKANNDPMQPFARKILEKITAETGPSG